MIKSCVTIALVPQIKTGPWIFWEDLPASIIKAANLGFDGIELFTASADALNPLMLNSLLENSGLKLAAVGTGAGKVMQGLTLTDPNPSIRKKAVAFICDMISFGARFKAPAIIGSMQGNVAPGIEQEQAMEWLADGLTTLGKFAEAKEVNLIYEPLNRYETNLINNLRDGVSLLHSLSTQNVKLLADLFHMNIEEESLPESIWKFSSSIGHIHFADSNRRAIGFGHTLVPEIAAALKEANYNGYLSAEALPWPNPDAAARQTIVAFKEYFRN